MGVVLPFELDVEMRMYHNKSFPLGIIKANIDDYDVWLCNKLIDCVYRNGTFDSVEEDIWSTRDGLTFNQNMWLAPETFAKKGLDLITLNISMLDEGFYITGAYNEFYIPSKRPYNKFNFNHDYVIFGYDNECFKSAAYMENSKYEFFDLKFEDYFKGVIKNTPQKIGLNFHQINKKYASQINIDLIKSKLHSYLRSPVDDQGRIYGITAWDKLSDYILSNENVDLRFSRAFMEHRNVMSKRISKLNELSYINNKSLVTEYYTNIYLKSKIVHNLFIKYYIKKDSCISYRASDLILSINSLERELIQELLNSF